MFSGDRTERYSRVHDLRGPNGVVTADVWLILKSKRRTLYFVIRVAGRSVPNRCEASQ